MLKVGHRQAAVPQTVCLAGRGCLGSDCADLIGLGLAWSWPRSGLVLVLDLARVWTGPVLGLVLFWVWTGTVLGLVLSWVWTGTVLGLAWSCHGSGLGLCLSSTQEDEEGNSDITWKSQVTMETLLQYGNHM